MASIQTKSSRRGWGKDDVDERQEERDGSFVLSVFKLVAVVSVASKGSIRLLSGAAHQRKLR